MATVIGRSYHFALNGLEVFHFCNLEDAFESAQNFVAREGSCEETVTIWRQNRILVPVNIDGFLRMMCEAEEDLTQKEKGTGAFLEKVSEAKKASLKSSLEEAFVIRRGNTLSFGR